MTEPVWSLSQEHVGDFGIFGVFRKRGRSPRTGGDVTYHVLEMADWVQIIPRTLTGLLVMVEQFRVGAEVSSLEFPAGLMDEGETPERTGLRELEEETGYRSQSAHVLGSIFPNPAIQSNRLHIMYADGCEPGGSMSQDDGEDIRIRLVEESELPDLVRRGVINHALVLTAWQLYELWRVQRSASRT